MLIELHSLNQSRLFYFSHSPFRQHKTKDKHEIDRMTMTMVGFASCNCHLWLLSAHNFFLLN